MKKLLSLITLLLCVLTIIGCNKKEQNNETYKIIYVLDGGVLPNNYVKEFNPNDGLATLPVPTKDGYNFSGWYMDDSLVTNINKDTKNDVTLKAKWEKIEEIKYTITYNLDGGTIEVGGVDSFTSKEGVEKLPVPVKEGYTFLGWYMDNALISCIEKGTEKNVILEARWEEKVVGVYYTITYNFTEGVLPENAPRSYLAGVGCELLPLENSSYGFSYWVDNNFNRVDRITSSMSGDIVLTAAYSIHTEPSNWKFNLNDYNGQGMKYQIMVDDVNKYDPNSEKYKGENKLLKQTQLSKVESAYNIVIEYVDGNTILDTDYNTLGYKEIIENYNSEKLEDVYVFNFNSLYIPLLKDVIYNIGNASGSEILDKLYMESGSGLVKYEQDPLIKDIFNFRGLQYGYSNEFIIPDHFMYYNVELVKSLGLDDPAELWLKGEWTIDKFNEYIVNANSTLKNKGYNDSYVLDMNYANAVLGITSSNGVKTIKPVPPLIYIGQESYKNKIDLFNELYKSGFYAEKEFEDVSNLFAQGKSIFHDGKMSYLKSADYFNPAKMTFTIGVVPYPLASNEGVIVNTTLESKDAIKKSDSSPLETSNGEYISGIDISSTAFNMPITEANGYLFLKKDNFKNDINLEIIVNILHDIEEGYDYANYNYSQLKPLEEEELYRNYLASKFDRNVDIEVVLSCMSNMYYDLIYSISYSACDGEKLGENSFYKLIQNMILNGYNQEVITEHITKYKVQLRTLGD